MYGHVVFGEAIDEACQRNRPVKHRCAIGQEERRHRNRGGFLVELIGDVAQDGGLAPDMINQVRPI